MDNENLILYSENFNFYLEEYKNYCELKPKNQSFNPDDDSFFEILPTVRFNRWEIKSPPNNFSNPIQESEYEENKLKINFFSLKEKFLIKITENDSKVSFKLYSRRTTKKVGEKFFRISSCCYFVTYSKIRNIFYHGKIVDYHKKKKFYKEVKTIKFNLNPFEKIGNILANILPGNFTTRLENCSLPVFKNEFVNTVCKKFYFCVYPEFQKDNVIDFSISFKKLYESRGIKLPNNWTAFKNTYLPDIKFFKKNKNKFIDTVMYQNNVKGDKIKKAFHMVTNFENISAFKWACNFFGEKFILAQEPIFIVKLLSFPFTLDFTVFTIFSKNEKKNILKILDLVMANQINTNTFCDHFMMINKLQNLEKVKWSSNDYNTFSEEHKLFTDKVSFYSKGILVRDYEKNFSESLQEVITIENQKYFPILLKSTNEYNNESFIQSNCVKTYVNYPHCVIFSLRKNSPDSEERITIEFNIKKVNNFILLKRTQTLGRFNKPINSEYDEVCKIFDERIKTFLLKNDFILPNVKLLIANKIFDSKIIYSDKSKSFEWGSENFNNILSYGCLTTNFQHHIEHDEVDIF